MLIRVKVLGSHLITSTAAVPAPVTLHSILFRGCRKPTAGFSISGDKGFQNERQHRPESKISADTTGREDHAVVMTTLIHYFAKSARAIDQNELGKKQDIRCKTQYRASVVTFICFSFFVSKEQPIP